MESLKLDLHNLGKSKYLYNEVFSLADYKQFRESNDYKMYLETLKETAEVTSKLFNIPVSKLFWLTPIFFMGIFIPHLAVISAIIFILSCILAVARTSKIYKNLSSEYDKLEEKLTKLTDKNLYVNYFHKNKESYEYYTSSTSVNSFKRFSRYLDKLNDYESITVYHLEKELSYPTENYNYHYKNLLFEDTTTGKFFTYAYSASLSQTDEEKVNLLTIFDIDMDTFEYKPRL